MPAGRAQFRRMVDVLRGEALELRAADGRDDVAADLALAALQGESRSRELAESRSQASTWSPTVWPWGAVPSSRLARSSSRRSSTAFWLCAPRRTFRPFM